MSFTMVGNKKPSQGQRAAQHFSPKKIDYDERMQVIEGNPTIHLYDTPEELYTATGQRQAQGFFDAKANLIAATIHSVAHEIGHYRDFQSGRMAVPASAVSSQERTQMKLRNEIVATLFARSKTSAAEAFSTHEVDFLAWFELERSRKNLPKEYLFELGSWPFARIQDFAEWVVSEKHPWFGHLLSIFRPYLEEETRKHGNEKLKFIVVRRIRARIQSSN